MNLKELKSFINKLPDHMDEFNLVNGEVGYLDPEDNNSAVYRLDKPIISVFVDEKEGEICLLHQTREDINNILPSGNT
jgi:hypothetical protein